VVAEFHGEKVSISMEDRNDGRQRRIYDAAVLEAVERSERMLRDQGEEIFQRPYSIASRILEGMEFIMYQN